MTTSYLTQQFSPAAAMKDLHTRYTAQQETGISRSGQHLLTEHPSFFPSSLPPSSPAAPTILPWALHETNSWEKHTITTMTNVDVPARTLSADSLEAIYPSGSEHWPSSLDSSWSVDGIVANPLETPGIAIHLEKFDHMDYVLLQKSLAQMLPAVERRVDVCASKIRPVSGT